VSPQIAVMGLEVPGAGGRSVCSRSTAALAARLLSCGPFGITFLGRARVRQPPEGAAGRPIVSRFAAMSFLATLCLVAGRPAPASSSTRLRLVVASLVGRPPCPCRTGVQWLVDRFRSRKSRSSYNGLFGLPVSC